MKTRAVVVNNTHKCDDYNARLVRGRLSGTVIKTQYHIGRAVTLHQSADAAAATA